MGFFNRRKRQIAPEQPQTVVGRISNLLRANIHAALDQAEDPEKMLDQFVRDFTDNIKQAEVSVAETIGRLRLMEKDRVDAQKEADSWKTKAIAASDRAESRRAKGQIKQADSDDELARVALKRMNTAFERVQSLDPIIADQQQVVEQLKMGLDGMHVKLSELKSKRSELIARSRTADAQERMVDSVAALNGADPTSQITRFEESVRKREAIAQGRIEITASSMESRFSELEATSADARVDDQLSMLKQGQEPLRIEAGAPQNAEAEEG